MRLPPGQSPRLFKEPQPCNKEVASSQAVFSGVSIRILLCRQLTCIRHFCRAETSTPLHVTARLKIASHREDQHTSEISIYQRTDPLPRHKMHLSPWPLLAVGLAGLASVPSAAAAAKPKNAILLSKVNYMDWFCLFSI